MSWIDTPPTISLTVKITPEQNPPKLNNNSFLPTHNHNKRLSKNTKEDKGGIILFNTRTPQ
jgi:hypothetical protein